MTPSKEEPTLHSGPCGSYCSNNEAEIIAIQKTLDTLLQQFESGSSTPTDTVIFSDSLSAIQAIENSHGNAAKDIEEIILTCDRIMSLHGITITIQWIPGHSDISMNDKADGLAKMGSHMQQENTNTSYDTAKQIAKQNTMETWHNNWALGDKGSRLYQQSA